MNIFNKKWIRWVFGMLCIGCILLAIVAISLPNLVGLSSVHQKIESYLAHQVQGQLTYENMVLAYLPRPCFKIQNIRISIPKKITGTISQLRVTPSLLSLLTGKIRIADIEAVNPDCKIEMPSYNETQVFQFEDLHEKLFNKDTGGIPLKSLRSVTFRDGRISVVHSPTLDYTFKALNGTYRQSPLSTRLKLSCTSDFWDQADIEVNFNVAKQFGEGSIALNSFTPQDLTTRLWPDAALRVIDAQARVNCDFTFDTTGHLNLTLKADQPTVTLQKGEKVLQLTGNTISASILRSADQMKIAVTHADWMYPELKFSGHFLMDKKRPLTEWSIEAKDIDIPTLRRTSDFTVGNFQVARILSNVIRDGFVSEFHIQNHATSPSGLKSIKNLKLHGLIENGYIFVPGAGLHLKEVTGDVSAANYTLIANPITARLGKAVGKNGYFSLFIGPGSFRPFHVDTHVEADLWELPSVLGQLIPNPIVKQEMANITESSGSAYGNLVIKRVDEKLVVDVDVSSFDLKGTYRRIPFPITCQGGKFVYREGNIQLHNLKGNIGGSTFSNVGATLDWKKKFMLTIPKGTATVVTDEIYPWLLTYSNVRNAIKYLRSLSGRATIQKMSFNGPLFSPGDWQYSFTTQADNLYVDLPIFPEPILCCGGSIIIEPDILYFDNTQVSVLDANAHMVGAFSGHVKDNRKLDAYFQGDLGNEMSIWIQQNTGLPDDFKWQTPVAVPNMHLVWWENKGLTVSLQATLTDVLSVSMDLSNTNNELLINHLSIQDQHSKAEMCMFREKGITDVEFSGKLTATTLDKLLLKNTLLSGSVQGDFNAQYVEAAPHKSTMFGKLYIDGLQFYRFDWPYQIEQLSLEGRRQGIDIAQARLIWEDSLVYLTGSIEHFREGLKLNGKLIADRIDWQQIVDTFHLQEQPQRETIWPLDIYGTLKVASGTFKYSDAVVLAPFETTMQFDKDALSATLEKAELCGISIPGNISITPRRKELSLSPTAKDRSLALPFSCIGNKRVFMDGRFSVQSNLDASVVNNDPIAPACRGNIIFTAKNGRIYKMSLLAKIFTLLNIAELVTGDFPDLEKEGFPYKKATVRGDFKNGVLVLKEGVIDSPAMKIFFHGQENYLNKTHDITIVVAPLKTVDMVVEKIPVVKEVLNKGFVIYPIKVTGSWENPKLQPLSTEAVGMEVLGIIGRTLNLPATLLKKVFPSEKKEGP